MARRKTKTPEAPEAPEAPAVEVAPEAPKATEPETPTIEAGHVVECALEELGSVRAKLCSELSAGSVVSTRRAGKRATVTVIKVG